MFPSNLRIFPAINRLDSHLKELLQGTLVAFILRFLGTGLRFGYNALLAKTLGAEGAGIYYLALSITMVATIIGKMGLDRTLLKYIATNAVVENWEGLSGVYRNGLRLAAIASLGTTAVIWVLAPFLAQKLFSNPELTHPLQFMAFSIVPGALLTLQAEMLKGLKRIRDAVFVQSISSPLIGIPLLIVLNPICGVYGAIGAYAISTVVALILGIILWRRATPHLKKIKGSLDTSVLIKTSIPLFWVALMSYIMSSSSTILLGIWTDNETVGIYSIAARTAMLTSFILVAIDSIAAPKFAAIYKKNDFKSLNNLVRNTAFLATTLSIPPLLLFVLAPEWILKIFGADFQKGAITLIILSIGQFVAISTGSVLYLLIMSGYEKSVRNTYFVFALLNVGIGIVLISKYGLIGAAMTTAIGLGSINIFFAYLAHKKLAIWAIPIPTGTVAKSNWI